MLDTIETEQADAIIIAGDVFDVASPSSEAQGLYYDFLAQCRRRFPELDLVLVGGNHDSPARLDAPADVLDALGISVVGGLPQDLDRVLIPLHHKKEIAAWVVAVPFLRPRDLPSIPQGRYEEVQKTIVEGHRKLYRQLTNAALARRTPGQALVATGHLYMADGLISELSERKIQVGYQHALPVDIFPPELAYVALGHLHRAQRVAGHNHIRYSGSPIPLSLAERTYEHQVVAVELDGERFVRARPIPIPRTVDILVVPEEHQELEEVLPLLEFLPRDDGQENRPFLEVRIKLTAANPRLRQEVEAALQGARARLLRIDVKRPEAEHRPLPSIDLDAIAPADVFRRAYERQRGVPPSEELIRLFLDLEQAVQQEDLP